MKTIIPLVAASILGLGMISAAGAQEYGAVPNGAYQDYDSVQTGRGAVTDPRFQALASARHNNITNGSANGTGGIFDPPGAL